MNPLQEYFDILVMVGSQKIESFNSDTGVDMDKAVSLWEMGFIKARDRRTQGNVVLGEVQLTPQGAAVLAEWSGILERNTIKGRFMAVLEKVVWLFVGMLFTVAGILIINVLNGV